MALYYVQLSSIKSVGHQRGLHQSLPIQAELLRLCLLPDQPHWGRRHFSYFARRSSRHRTNPPATCSSTPSPYLVRCNRERRYLSASRCLQNQWCPCLPILFRKWLIDAEKHVAGRRRHFLPLSRYASPNWPLPPPRLQQRINSSRPHSRSHLQYFLLTQPSSNVRHTASMSTLCGRAG